MRTARTVRTRLSFVHHANRRPNRHKNRSKSGSKAVRTAFRTTPVLVLGTPTRWAWCPNSQPGAGAEPRPPRTGRPPGFPAKRGGIPPGPTDAPGPEDQRCARGPQESRGRARKAQGRAERYRGRSRAGLRFPDFGACASPGKGVGFRHSLLVPSMQRPGSGGPAGRRANPPEARLPSSPFPPDPKRDLNRTRNQV